MAVLATYFYARVSAHDQNLDRQLIAANGRGVPPERVFTEKLSGKDTKRPELQRLMATVCGNTGRRGVKNEL
jgi:DNA invertase Pin-like site-specific DNA recombinase